MTNALLSVQAVNKAFGDYQALRNINLEVKHGEFIAMLGPSGCGKTTLLRSIAGFLIPDKGRILMEGNDVTQLPPNKRPVNTVFQNYALFPHMSVLENICYGPRRSGDNKAEAIKKSEATLELVGLAQFSGRFPRELSGGQQQRVALARALVNRPKLLLLDEPLSALDAKLRKHMQIELKQLQKKLGVAFLFVTHDQEEAMTMADRVVVMNQGNIEQIGNSYDIYNEPITRFVSDFVGEANYFSLENSAIGRLIASSSKNEWSDEISKSIMLRPEHFSIQETKPNEGLFFSAVILELMNVGPYMNVIIQKDGQQFTVRCEAQNKSLKINSNVWLTFKKEYVRMVSDA